MPCVLPLTIATLPASREVDDEVGDAASEAACEGA
jgi:hypothetical protein